MDAAERYFQWEAQGHEGLARCEIGFASLGSKPLSIAKLLSSAHSIEFY